MKFIAVTLSSLIACSLVSTAPAPGLGSTIKSCLGSCFRPKTGGSEAASPAQAQTKTNVRPASAAAPASPKVGKVDGGLNDAKNDFHAKPPASLAPSLSTHSSEAPQAPIRLQRPVKNQNTSSALPAAKAGPVSTGEKHQNVTAWLNNPKNDIRTPKVK